jgi:hypothetical protein
MRRACRQAWTGWRHTLVVVAVAVLLAAPARAEGPDPEQGPPGGRLVTVFNHSSRPINELYVSPQTADQWGEDHLGDHTLDPGAFLRLHLGRSRGCVFDFKIIYDDASREEQRGVNLCRTRQLAFDGSAATPAPDSDVAHSITLVNQSAAPIQQVYISPAEANQWGDDRLGQNSISVGDRRAVTWRGDCDADLRVVFENRAAEERRGVNLCAVPALSIEPGWTTADVLPVPKQGAPAEATAANRPNERATAPP